MNIETIKLRPFGRGKRCDLRINHVPLWFQFTDLVEFSQGVARALMVSERLHAPHALHPDDRTYMQIEGVHIEDAGERNKRTIAWREVKERRADGAMLAGGRWYMELSVNGCDNDCSFSTALELMQCLQTIIRREMQNHGQIATGVGLVEVAHA